MFFNKKKNDYFALLEKYLETGHYSIFACGQDFPNETEILAFEEQVGYPLPDDFKLFSMSPQGGIYVEVKEELWPRAKVYDVAPFWTFLFGFYVYGFAQDVPEWMDIRKGLQSFRTETESTYTPFMKVIGDADVYCFGENQNIYRFSHETYEFEPVEKTFLELLEFELSELKERKERKAEMMKK